MLLGWWQTCCKNWNWALIASYSIISGTQKLSRCSGQAGGWEQFLAAVEQICRGIFPDMPCRALGGGGSDLPGITGYSWEATANLPDEPLTRAQAVVILKRFYEFFSKQEIVCDSCNTLERAGKNFRQVSAALLQGGRKIRKIRLQRRLKLKMS